MAAGNAIHIPVLNDVDVDLGAISCSESTRRLMKIVGVDENRGSEFATMLCEVVRSRRCDKGVIFSSVTKDSAV